MNRRQETAIEKRGLDSISEKVDRDGSALGTDGFSLIEVLVVIAIVGILGGMAIASYAGMTRKYNIDNQARRIHADLSKVRLMALTKGRMHFVTLAAGGYTAYDDNSPAPDGNEELTVGSDSVALRSNEALNLSTVTDQQFQPIAWSGNATMAFNPRGLSTAPNTVCIFSNVTPRYDCINISPARIALGKLNVQGVCNAANCRIQ